MNLINYLSKYAMHVKLLDELKTNKLVKKSTITKRCQLLHEDLIIEQRIYKLVKKFQLWHKDFI